MGTKQNPGKFDCYAKLEPDEPYLTLRAKDPAAPYLVMMWAASRRGDIMQVSNLAMAMMMNKDVVMLFSDKEFEKLGEANKAAEDMRQWRADKKQREAGDAGA